MFISQFSSRLILVCAAAPLLIVSTGCLSIPRSPTDEELLATALPDPEQVRQQWAARSHDGSVDSAWVQSFKDPALESYVAEVLAGNLELDAALHTVEAAAAGARRAGALLQPQLNAVGSASHLGGFENSNRESDSKEAAAQLAWELDLWGRVRAGRAAAEAALHATEADYHDARLSMVAAAARTWYLATETHLQRAFAREIVDIQSKRLELVTTKFDEGELSSKEKHLAAADLNSARDRLAQVSLAHRDALRALEVMAGQYPAAHHAFSKQYVPIPPPVPAGVPAQLIERRPDLRAAAEEVRAAFNLVHEARAARLPRISLTAGAGRSSNDLIKLLGNKPGFWTTAANFLAPIYQGGALKAQVEIQTAQQAAAVARFGQHALRAFSEVENALDSEKILIDRERYLKGALDENSEALRVAQAQFDAGKLDLLSVLQMQERVIAAKIAWINIRNARLTQRINLHLALGGSFD